MADVDHLIIGGGIAAVACARRLREEDPATTILVASRELDLPYDRTLCSKSYLAGPRTKESTHLLAADWWASSGIDLRTGTSVLGLDAAARVAKLSSKEEVSFGQALVATGANVRRLAVEGSQLHGTHYLRTLGNADAIRRDLGEAEDVVLIGGSYIGCEVAATLTTMGKRCTVLMRENFCMEHHIGGQGGRFIQELLEANGVRFVAADELDRFEGDGERVTRVVTASGRTLPADVVVIGVGAVPDVRLARAAGLDFGATGGVACDALLRTSAEGIYCAGDACEWDSSVHSGPTRVEHWDVAERQGAIAATNMLGGSTRYEDQPTFWSDLADWATLRFVGVVGGETQVLRGEPDDGSFSIWFLDADRIRGVLSVGCDDELDAAGALIGARVGGALRAALADAATPLSELAPQPT